MNYLDASPKEYWISRADKIDGPWSEAQMVDSWKAGILEPGTACSVKGVEGWVKAENLDCLRGIHPGAMASKPVRIRSEWGWALISVFFLLSGFAFAVKVILFSEIVVQGVNNIGLITNKICCLLSSIGCFLFGGQMMIYRQLKRQS